MDPRRTFAYAGRKSSLIERRSFCSDFGTVPTYILIIIYGIPFFFFGNLEKSQIKSSPLIYYIHILFPALPYSLQAPIQCFFGVDARLSPRSTGSCTASGDLKSNDRKFDAGGW